ncbi:MAG: inverse autotransporter beta domain-containing protein, partial [Hyphomicrobiales bacterium]|nr:inverse autotransporter beta domain-containing protein [Hyphomicrobiales bacterium]
MLLPVGAFLLLSIAGLSSSSEADEPLFMRSAQQLERLWSGVLGCTHPGEGEPRSTFETTFDGGGAPSAIQHDYVECGKRALRNTTSRMLVDTIEDAVRSGGVALFEERFRLTSGIGWVWGENVTGELDALIPLLDNELSDGTGQALFLQPGAIFWPGLEGENRIDANLGLVYRRHFTPDIVVGGSAFYDYDFKQGGQRVGLGLDLQSGILHTALNYYHPLDDWQEGRTGYVEQPLQGADFRLGAAWSHLQLDANLGIWRFEGEEEEKTKWRPAFGVEAGYRVLPGVFLQGGYEQHDSDDSLDSRWNAGLAFRFSLPGFEGGEGGNGRMAAPDLWELVEREKRVLYEERSGLAVEMIVGNAVIREPGDAGNEPTTTKITGVVSGRQLREDETLEVVIYESTTAEHGAGNDFTFSQGVYGVDAQTGDQIALTASAACTTSPCRMDAPANSRAKSIEIEVSALDDSVDRELPEFIDMRVDVRDKFGSLVYSSNVARVTIRGHGNTVAFSSDAGTIAEEEATSFDITLRIEQPLPAGTNASVALSAAHEGGATSSDYEFVPPADSSANGTISGNTWTLPTEQREARLQIRAVDDGEDDDDESVTFTLADLTGATGWSLGSAITQTVTITDNDEADSAAGPRTKSAIIWGDIFTPGGDIDETIRIIVNENTVQFASGASTVAEDVVGGRHFVRVAVDRPTQEVTLRITASGGSASDGSDYSVDFDSNASVDASSGTVEIPVTIVNDEIAGEGDETIELTIDAREGDLPNRWRIGSRTTHTVTITDDDEGVIGFVETGSRVDSEPANGTSTHNVALAVSKLPASPFNLVINGAGGGGGARFGSNANDDANAAPTVTVSSATVSGTTLNIPVTIRADSDSEIDETIVLTIPPNGNGLPASGFSLGANTQHTITIPANDNTIGFASSSDDSLDESDTAATATVTIEIEQQLQTSSVAGIVVAQSSTVVDSDYSITGTGYDSDTGILTLPANTSSVDLTVTVVDDDVV